MGALCFEWFVRLGWFGFDCELLVLAVCGEFCGFWVYCVGFSGLDGGWC